MKYRPEIDGLRAVAVIPVILFHAGLKGMSGGFIGVDVFFVISGFLITTIIANELNQQNFSLTHFYERRARRILPALFLIMAASIPMALMWMDPDQLSGYSKSLAAVSVFSSNILFWLESSYWGVASELKPLIHTWSLAIEEQYYLLFPLLMMLIWRFNKKWVWLVLFSLMVLSLGLAQWASHAEPEAAFFLLPTRAWELIIGAIIALCLLNKTATNTIQNMPLKGSETIALLGLVMIVIAVVTFDASTPHPSLLTLIPTVGTGLVLLFANKNTWTGQLLSSRILTTIGLWSYSAYLWHQLLFVFAKHHFINDPSAWVMAGLTLLTFPLAYITHRFIEAPFRNPKIISRKGIFNFAIAGTLLFLIIGLWGINNAINHSLLASEGYFDRKHTIDQLQSRRVQLVNQSNCHFSKWGNYKKVAQFMQQWSCLPNDEPQLRSSNVAVYGDSHGADLANMIRLNGFDFLQLGGQGCPLSEGGRKRCQRVLKFFHKQTALNNIKTVILANRFQKNELSEIYILQLLDYWSSRYEKVVLLSPMIEFPRWQKTYILTGTYDFQLDLSAHELFFKTLANLAIPENVTVVDTSLLICDSLDSCSGLSEDGSLLVTDYGHLSEFGASQLGEKLLPIINSYLPDDQPTQLKQ